MPKRWRNSGFSLLEIMAVITILGIAIASVSLTIGRGGAENQITEKLERFMGISRFAADRAVLSGEPMGLLLQPPQWQSDSAYDWETLGWRYRWQTGTAQGWLDIPESEFIAFDPETKIDVLIDDLPWRWEDLLDRSLPVTAFYPTGEITSIELIFTDSRVPDFQQTVHVNEDGELEWKELAEELKARADKK
jgi:general secretion pathway protein H